MKTTLRHLFQLSLCMLLLASVASANPTAFEEAQRSGEDVPGGSLHWTFRWDGKPVTVNTDGKGSVDGKEFQVPLNSTRLTARLFRRQQKTRRSGFFQDHSNTLSGASEAMVDHP